MGQPFVDQKPSLRLHTPKCQPQYITPLLFEQNLFREMENMEKLFMDKRSMPGKCVPEKKRYIPYYKFAKFWVLVQSESVLGMEKQLYLKYSGTGDQNIYQEKA